MYFLKNEPGPCPNIGESAIILMDILPINSRAFAEVGR